MKRSEWACEIRRISNGYAVRYPGEKSWVTRVMADGDDELSSTSQLLWWILEYYDRIGSKHDAQRLRVCRENRDGTLAMYGMIYRHAGDGQYPVTSDAPSK